MNSCSAKRCCRVSIIVVLALLNSAASGNSCHRIAVAPNRLEGIHSVSLFEDAGSVIETTKSSTSTSNVQLNDGSQIESDSYWQYYDDCDRWGAVFLTSQCRFRYLANTVRLEPNLNSSSPKFKQIRYRKHSRPDAAALLSKKLFDGLQRVTAIGQSVLSQIDLTFKKLIYPQLQYLEFVEVETRSYPGFFLDQPAKFKFSAVLKAISTQRSAGSEVYLSAVSLNKKIVDNIEMLRTWIVLFGFKAL